MLAGGAGWSRAVSISPVRLTLQAGERLQTLILGNDSTAPIKIQVNIARWEQDRGYDLQAPQTVFLASPAAFVLPPGQRRVVRIALVGALSGQGNEFFRVSILESRQAGLAGSLGASVNMIHLLPFQVLREPLIAGEPLCLRENGQLFLRNTGNQLLRATRLQLGRAGETQDEPWAEYVLPGHARLLRSATVMAGTPVASVQIEGREAPVACPE